MNGILKFLLLAVTTCVLLVSCAATDKDPPLDSNSLQPTLQQQNEAKIQSAVYQ